ncbi:hypothetical protein FPV67DRAFT_1604272, partial [Lyophyllum atratum]
MDSTVSQEDLNAGFDCYNLPHLDLSPLLEAATKKQRLASNTQPLDATQPFDASLSIDASNSSIAGGAAQRLAPYTQPPIASPSIDASNLSQPPNVSAAIVVASNMSDLHGAARHKNARKMKRQHKRLVMGVHIREARLNLSNVERAGNYAVPVDHSEAAHSKPGYIGLRVPTGDFGEVSELLKKGFSLVKYERKSRAFSDKHNRIFAVFVDRPPGMLGLNAELCSAMADAQAKLLFGKSSNAKDCSTKVKPPRRGDFPTISVGISHGGGQPEPGNLVHSAVNQEVLDKLLDSPAVKRTAAFQSKCYRTWMPRLYDASNDVLSQLLDWKPTLRRNFTNSVYCCTTFNFGPHVVCRGHRDHLNWAPGGCIITSGGEFDYVRGGHIVLEEAKLIIEFPPGCSVIIPSACITHGNTPILESEHRISMTQYTAGGL